MKRTIFILFLVMVMLLSSLSTVFATTISYQYITAPTTAIINLNSAGNGKYINIYDSRGIKVFGFSDSTSTLQFKDITTSTFKNKYGADANTGTWNTNTFLNGPAVFPLCIEIYDGYNSTNLPYQSTFTGVVYDADGININDTTPISALPQGITIISPSSKANILDDYINIKFTCKVPIQSDTDTNALIAEITGQRIECYATTDKTGSAKYYLPRHDGLKPHFRTSDIVDRNSLYYLVNGTISVPNHPDGVVTSIHIKLPEKTTATAGIVNSDWVEYNKSLRTLNNDTLPPDVGGSTVDTGDPNQPIGDMPDAADYDRTTVTGNLDYWGDTILWFISLPFQALAKAASALTDRISQATQWIGTQDTGVIGFFNIIFSFLPDEVTGLITVLIILFIVICIYKFMRG